MEKKTIVPEKSKKRAFIENLIFCILIIIAVVGCVCAWAIVVSKSEEIITNESMQLEVDTQKERTLFNSDDLNVFENYSRIVSAYSSENFTYNTSNLYAYGVGGNSFSSYVGSGNESLMNFLGNEQFNFGDYNYSYSFLNFVYDFNENGYYAFNPNSISYDFYFLPICNLPSTSLYYSNFETLFTGPLGEDEFLYLLCSVDFMFNDTILCNCKYNTSLTIFDSWLDWNSSNSYFTFNDYSNYNISISKNYDSLNFRADSIFDITSINVNYYLGTTNGSGLNDDFNSGFLDGLIFGLCSTADNFTFSSLYNFMGSDGFLNYPNGILNAYVSYLPNQFYGISNYLYESSFYDGYDIGYEVGFDNGTSNGYANGYQQGVSDTLEQVGTDWFTTNNYISTISFSYVDDYGVLVPLNFQFDYGSDSVGSYINFTNLSYQQGYTNKITIYFNYAFLPKLIRSTAPFTSCFNGTANVNVSYFGDGIYGVNNENLDKFGSDNYISLAWDNSVPSTFRLYIQGFSTDIASYEEFFNKGFNEGFEKGSANGYKVGYDAGLQNNNFIGNARLYLLLKYHLILLNKFGILKF